MNSPQTNLIDLDELLLKCRDDRSRDYMKEAVNSYKVGVYRSAIVMTWIGVVFDIFDKIRELATQGDLRAKQETEKLDAAIERQDINQFLTLERDILTVARDAFQMITHIEFVDLNRLREDRQLCAHPSFNKPEEYYFPSAELTRTHIRNAIEHLLSQPPTQGQAALKRILKDMDSLGFRECKTFCVSSC